VFEERGIPIAHVMHRLENGEFILAIHPSSMPPLHAAGFFVNHAPGNPAALRNS
jgi:hypothetical protein